MKVDPIGIIHSPFKSKKEAPIQPFRSNAVGRVEVFKEYGDGLRDIEGFSHVILIFEFHKSRGFQLKVKPFLDNTERGLFATRAPRRPNRIGMTVVRLIRRRGNTLVVRGIDTIDGTPLLDIKPYVPDFNTKGKIKIGWLKGKIR